MNFPMQLTRIILRHLFIGWLLLSLVLTAALLYYKMVVIDQRLLEMAVKEAYSLVVESNWNSPAQEKILKQKTDEFLKGPFEEIDLYDRNQQEVLHDSQLDAVTEKKLKLEMHGDFSPLAKESYHKIFLAGGSLYVQVVVPLLAGSGDEVGYFVGAYLVDAKTMRDIESEIAVAMALLFAVTLAIAGFLYPLIDSLDRKALKLSSDLMEGNIELLKVLGSAIAKRDSDTGSHNYRVTIYAIRLAEAVKLRNEQIRELIMGAFLHDVGKIGISDSILLKHAKLSEEEFAAMRKHVPLGADIISNSQWLRGARHVLHRQIFSQPA